MQLFDISVTLGADTPPWPGDTPYSCEWPALIAQGSSVNVSAVTSSPHVGTHADAPLHVRDGWPGAEELSIDAFFGPAVVVDVSAHDRAVSLDELKRALGGEPTSVLGQSVRLLLRTGRTIATGQFPESWPVLTPECMRNLLEHGLRLLGTDAPSVDPRDSRGLEVHNLIFSANGAILENLDLRRVPEGRYELMAFPLKLLGTDATPVRAVLRAV